MAKYKDVDRLMAILEYRCNEADNVEAWLAFAMACEDVRDLPDADVVEVIRCKDCKYGDTGTDEIGRQFYKCIGLHYGSVSPTGYCSYGERKDG